MRKLMLLSYVVSAFYIVIAHFASAVEFENLDSSRIVLKETDAPIIIHNASKNIRCTFRKGEMNSYQPNDEINLVVDAETPINTALINEDKLSLWSFNKGFNYSSKIEESQLKPELCDTLITSLQKKINDNDKLVINAKRRILVQFEKYLVEEHSGELILDLVLPEFKNEPIKLTVGRSVVLFFDKILPHNYSDLYQLAGERKGTVRLHPQAASDFGLRCVPDPQFFFSKYSVQIGLVNGVGVANLTSAKGIENLSGLKKEDCEIEREKIISHSKKVDPKNHGEVVDVIESTQWFQDKELLHIQQDFKVHNKPFTSSVYIRL